MFYVNDLETASDFYKNVLGLKKGWEDKENKQIGFIFDESDSEIVIHNDSTLPKFDYSFQVDDVEEFCKKYLEKGYKVVKDPFEVRCGKMAILEDLDANILPIIDLTKFGGKPRYD